MIFLLNLAAVATAASQTIWRHAKPIFLRDRFLLPCAGFLGVILLWWIIAIANHELMPTPSEAFIVNFDHILISFFPTRGNLGRG
jgi:nitrate/nitrite transport system permease protein